MLVLFNSRIWAYDKRMLNKYLLKKTAENMYTQRIISLSLLIAEPQYLGNTKHWIEYLLLTTPLYKDHNTQFCPT